MGLKEAIDVLVNKEHIDDFIYIIRERTHTDREYKGNSWAHPRVERYSQAVGVLQEYLKNETT